MGIKKVFLTGLMAGGVFGSAFAGGHTSDTLGRCEIRYVKELESWLSGQNPAGLTAVTAPNLFEATLSATRSAGKWVNYYQSPDSFEAGASVESYYRYSPKTLLYGRVEYSYFTGRDMGGSYFIDPTMTPFDIVEYTDSNRGTKKLESYLLSGGIGTEVTPKFRIGGEISYAAANYAKLKDLRHTNELMDMSIGAGVIYKAFKALDIGLNYSYRRRVEGLTIGSYGQGDLIFQSLVSYGAFFGSLETFGENGYTKENDDRPLIDEYHGGAVQAMVSVTDKIKMFNEFGYKWRKGQYGVKSPADVVYSEHRAAIVSYSGILSVRQRAGRHQLKLSFSRERLNNSENIYRYDNEEGGKNDVGYYGSVDVGVHTKHTASAGYTGCWGEKNDVPVWITRIGWDYFNRQQTASGHPYYRIQNLHSSSFSLSGEHNIIKGKNSFQLRLGGAYGYGGGNSHTDGTYTVPSASQPEPETMDMFLLREFEYLTASRVSGNVSFRYGRMLGGRGIRIFAAIGYDITHALRAEYTGGKNFHRMQIKIGCSF